MAFSKTAKIYTKPQSRYAGLTKTQTVNAKSFLSSILLGSVMANHAGVQMDIGKCIKAYRGNSGRWRDVLNQNKLSYAAGTQL